MSDTIHPEIKELTSEQINNLLGAIFPDIDPNNLQNAKIEDWSFQLDNYDPYLPPEARPTILVGRVYGHPKLTDGHLTATSAVKYWLFIKGIVLTRNTVYRLGTPDPNWLAWYNEDKGTNLTMEEMLEVYHKSFIENTRAVQNKP